MAHQFAHNSYINSIEEKDKNLLYHYRYPIWNSAFEDCETGTYAIWGNSSIIKFLHLQKGRSEKAFFFVGKYAREIFEAMVCFLEEI
jgi:hypothetical protein